jgi:hypothetical protein
MEEDEDASSGPASAAWFGGWPRIRDQVAVPVTI